MSQPLAADPTLLSQLEEMILILAPFGRDAQLAAQTLSKAGIRSEILPSLSAVCARLDQPHAAVLITE